MQLRGCRRGWLGAAVERPACVLPAHAETLLHAWLCGAGFAACSCPTTALPSFRALFASSDLELAQEPTLAYVPDFEIGPRIFSLLLASQDQT